MFTRKAFQMLSPSSRAFSTSSERLAKLRIGYIPGTAHHETADASQSKLISLKSTSPLLWPSRNSISLSTQTSYPCLQAPAISRNVSKPRMRTRNSMSRSA